MTADEVKAALALADAAKAKADAAARGPWATLSHEGRARFSVVVRGTVIPVAGVMGYEATADFIAAARQDVPALADAVRRLADEVKTLRAVLADATSESAMYERGVRDSLAVVEVMTEDVSPDFFRWPALALAADNIRALLPG